jgi:UDP-GlcNAc:undecaprenyl-phosphate GlcNAc-1-phosphate transferase
MLLAILGLLAGLGLEALVLYFLLNLLQESGAVKENYLGREIPVSAGISFPLDPLPWSHRIHVGCE